MLISQKLVHIFRGFYWHQENNSMITGLESNLDITFSMATFSHSRVIFTVSSIQSDWYQIDFDTIATRRNFAQRIQHDGQLGMLTKCPCNMYPASRFLSCTAFSSYEVVRVACKSRGCHLFYTPRPTTQRDKRRERVLKHYEKPRKRETPARRACNMSLL